MRVAFPANRATLQKLWAWRRAGRTTLGGLLALDWCLATRDDGQQVVLSAAIDEAAVSDVQTTLDQLGGVDWMYYERDGERGGERDGDGDAAMRLPEVVGPGLPLDVFLLVLPDNPDASRPRDVIVSARGFGIAQQIVEDLCAVADTTVLEGARVATGLRHASGDGEGADDTWWFRISDPPYFLLRRWLASTHVGFGPRVVRIFRLTPPTAAGRPHLWVQWNFQAALVSDKDFDPADTADQLLLVSPFEPLRMLPSNAFGPLAERIMPLDNDPQAGRVVAAPPGETRPEPVRIDVRLRQRSRYSGGARLWRLPEKRLREQVVWFEGLPEQARRNLMFAACQDASGAAILYLMEQVRGKTLGELREIADAMAEVPGLPNCYLAPGFHLVPEVNANALRQLIYRASTPAELAEGWARSAHADDPLWLELATEATLPLAIIEPESADDGAVLFEMDGRLPASAMALLDDPADRSTTRRVRPPAAAASASSVADPWGEAAVVDESAGRGGSLFGGGSREPGGGTSWRVWFLLPGSFRPFDQLGALLLRDSRDSLREWQEQVRVAVPERVAGGGDDDSAAG